MRQYTIYFEIFGKKMKTKVIAKTEGQAKQAIHDKLIFYKVELDKNEFNEIMDALDSLGNAHRSRP
jgi:hypothetical protein